MRKILLTVATSVLAIGGLALISSPAMARDRDEQEHRDHRSYDYHSPYTWQEHNRGHEEWERERAHEEREEHEFHHQYDSPRYQNYYPYDGSSYTPYRYSPYQSYYGSPSNGFGSQGHGFSIYLGR